MERGHSELEDYIKKVLKTLGAVVTSNNNNQNDQMNGNANDNENVELRATRKDVSDRVNVTKTLQYNFLC